jgi:uncharacterized protein YndB with AHSA1/START domain
MTYANIEHFDPELDLVIERVVDVPAKIIWKAWTQPEHVKKWFCPKPWYVAECEIELKPGGRNYNLMRGPNGEEHPNHGTYLEVIENRKLVFTDALDAGFRPRAHPMFMFTGMILLEPVTGGTKYTAMARHGTLEAAKKHAEMGFHVGWGIALDQLVACANAGEFN